MNWAIGGVPLKKIASITVFSAVSGLGVGKCLHNLKEHPGTGIEIIKYATVGGIVGGLVGVGTGLWFGKRTSMLILTQSMYGYLVTGLFLNVRSTISHERLTLPKSEKPLSDLLITAVSAGITGSIPSILSGFPPAYITGGCTAGLFFGFIGHIVYDQLCQARLEFLLRQQYPELIREHQEAEEFMIEQKAINYYYTGPIKDDPEWMKWAKSLWGDYGKRDLS